MRLKFLGAAHMVTGSCYLLETQGKKILIDCGLQQGRDEISNGIKKIWMVSPFSSLSVKPKYAMSGLPAGP